MHVLFQQLHHGHCSVCVQTSRGLVQEQDLWLDDELHANVSPLPLTTRHTTDELCTNLGEEDRRGVSHNAT